MGLPQPHLDRTRLCELGDEAFDKGYLEKRERLKSLLKATARSKVRAFDSPPFLACCRRASPPPCSCRCPRPCRLFKASRWTARVLPTLWSAWWRA